MHAAVVVPLHQQLAAYLASWARPTPDTLLACLTEDAVYEVVPLQLVTRGHAALQAFFTSVLRSVPDIRLEAVETLVLGVDAAATEWVLSGTARGPVLGLPATGGSFALRGASLFACAAGRIRRQVDYWNLPDLLVQLGLPLSP